MAESLLEETVRQGEGLKAKAQRGSGGEAREEEFARLYRANYELVYNYVSFRMAGSSDAEDVVADAFLKAAKAFSRFDSSRARFSTWVVSIARNCMTDYWRKHRANATIEDVPDSLVAVEDEYSIHDDTAEVVKKLLATLNDSDRELVFMKYYRGMKNIDIAKELGMNASTVATRVQRALARMNAAAQKPDAG